MKTKLLAVSFVAALVLTFFLSGSARAASSITWKITHPTQDCIFLNGTVAEDGTITYYALGDSFEAPPYTVPAEWTTPVLVDYLLYETCGPYYDAVDATFYDALIDASGAVTNKSYSPGETVIVFISGIAGDNPSFSGNSVDTIVDVVINAFETVLCWGGLFCDDDTPPEIWADAQFNNSQLFVCHGAPGCTATGSFSAPSAPGTYTITFTGSYGAANTGSSNLTFTVADASSAPPASDTKFITITVANSPDVNLFFTPP